MMRREAFHDGGGNNSDKRDVNDNTRWLVMDLEIQINIWEGYKAKYFY